jgi:hypothetical protein
MKRIKFLWLISASFLISCNYVEFNPAIKSGVDTAITKIDTVRYFVNSNDNGTWNVLILFPKIVVKDATDTTLYYIGNISNWITITIPFADKSYEIINGKAQRCSKANASYIGANFELTTVGLYNIALVHDGNIWADLTGRTAMLRADNIGLAWFYFDQGILTPEGDPKK